MPPSGSPSSHYAQLQLPSTATPEQLRQAFRSLSKLYHPDTTALPKDQAAESFLRLRQAYAVLSNPESRRQYDAELRQALLLASGSPPPPALGTPQGRPLPVRRALSGGEWLALLLLAVALVLSLLLGVGLALARGVELARLPSWWPPA